MNIAEAKEQIKRAVSIYLMKDAYGNYRIPLERQRPVFMIGAPGIGKTAIVSQVAQELDVSLVSYAMTHHTRQSALGLPFIEHKEYEGQSFDISKYTLSEILASVYESMEKSGKKEGILFLDEINCVSETLGPSMLQFLQYKTFGNHRLPDGWVVVTAGNPQEYNRSARVFDVATLDRLKVLPIEPDYGVWRQYAVQNAIHRSVLSFLDLQNEDFYKVEAGVNGQNYVTARGWEDLSDAIYLYEEKGFPVDETLINQYLHDEEVCSDFSVFYALFEKYKEAYPIADILAGNSEEEAGERMRAAGFDEKISLTNLLLDGVIPGISHNMELYEGLMALRDPLRRLKQSREVSKDLESYITTWQEAYKQGEAGAGLSRETKRKLQYEIAFGQRMLKEIALRKEEAPFAVIARAYQSAVRAMKEDADILQKKLDALFAFLEKNGSDQELLLVVTQLSVDLDAAKFIALHGCDAYEKHSDALQVKKRNEKLLKDLETYRKNYGENSFSL